MIKQSFKDKGYIQCYQVVIDLWIMFSSINRINKAVETLSINIQKKYKRVHDSKQDFVDAIVDFNLEPNEDKAMMYGALKKFGVMAKMPYSKRRCYKNRHLYV